MIPNMFIGLGVLTFTGAVLLLGNFNGLVATGRLLPVMAAFMFVLMLGLAIIMEVARMKEDAG